MDRRRFAIIVIVIALMFGTVVLVGSSQNSADCDHHQYAGNHHCRGYSADPRRALGHIL